MEISFKKPRKRIFLLTFQSKSKERKQSANKNTRGFRSNTFTDPKKTTTAQKAYDFKMLEKQMGIHKENKILMDRLVEISAGRSTMWKGTMPKINQRRQPGSLNYAVRKNNELQIEQENFIFAKRLMERYN